MLHQFLIEREHLPIDTAAQGLMLNFIELLKIQVIHDGLGLKRDASFLIAAKENLPVLDHLQFEQQRCLVQNDDIDAIRLQTIRQFAEEEELVIKELIGLDLIHQQNGDI